MRTDASIASVNHMRYSLGLFFIVCTVALFTIAAIVTSSTAIAQTTNRNTARTSVFDQQWLNTVVSIETVRGGQDPHPAGTGFLIRTQRGLAVLVTVKHVIMDAEQQLREGLVYRLNDTQSHSKLVTDAELQDRGLGGWFWSSTYDLACRFIVWGKTAEVAVIPLDKFLSWKEIQAGAPLLVLGFPLGLRSIEHTNPVVRSGVVARSDAQGLLADVAVFAGNSGGPVLYVPPIKVHDSLRTPFINEERLVGVVYEAIRYVERAVSPQTHRPRVIFEDNAGLARIVSSDAILALISRADVKNLEEQLAATREAG